MRLLLFILFFSSFNVFAYSEDDCKTDPYIACLGNQQEIEAMHQRQAANVQRREQYLMGVIQQTFGGQVAWNNYQLAYVVCEGGQLSYCGANSPTPIDSCQTCASGKLRVCSTTTQITKKGIVDTIRCGKRGERVIRLLEPSDIVQR